MQCPAMDGAQLGRPKWSSMLTMLTVFSFAHQPYVPAVLIASMCLLKMHTFRHSSPPSRIMALLCLSRLPLFGTVSKWTICSALLNDDSLPHYFAAPSSRRWSTNTNAPAFLSIESRLPVYFLGKPCLYSPAESLSQRQHHWTRRRCLLMQALHCRQLPFFLVYSQ